VYARVCERLRLYCVSQKKKKLDKVTKYFMERGSIKLNMIYVCTSPILSEHVCGSLCNTHDFMVGP
jgi:hypothetical protein